MRWHSPPEWLAEREVVEAHVAHRLERARDLGLRERIQRFCHREGEHLAHVPATQRVGEDLVLEPSAFAHLARRLDPAQERQLGVDDV